jgi:hypothetical protein
MSCLAPVLPMNLEVFDAMLTMPEAACVTSAP